jgi:hypothetical protein
MWTAALTFAKPIWEFIKPFWKHVVLVILVVVAIAWARSAYNDAIQASYDRGVAVEREAQEKLWKEREQENFVLTVELKKDAAVAQAKLEGKLREANITANTLRAQLRARRVCSDEASGRANPGNPGASSIGDGAPVGSGPATATLEHRVPTIGDDIAFIGEQCQVNTDKLITLQGYVRGLLDKLKSLRSKQLAAH